MIKLCQIKTQNVNQKIFKIFKKTIRIIIPIALLCLGIFIVLKTAHAQSYLGEGWDQYLKDNLKTFGVEGDGEVLATQFIQNLIRIVRYIVGAIALVMGTIYAMSLIFARGKEEVITKQKQNFLWVFLGFVILIISENIATIFNPAKATAEQIIDFGAAQDQLRAAADYIKWLFGSIFVLLMVISSIRMITAAGEEEEITKQKRNITWSLIGMLIVLMASNIVNAIYRVKSPKEISTVAPEKAITEITGIIQLILVFLGPAAVAFTIYAGFMYLTALDNEERIQKAKRMIIGGVTGIVIIYAAYAIINTIAAEELALLPSVFFT